MSFEELVVPTSSFAFRPRSLWTPLLTPALHSAFVSKAYALPMWRQQEVRQTAPSQHAPCRSPHYPPLDVTWCGVKQTSALVHLAWDLEKTPRLSSCT